MKLFSTIALGAAVICAPSAFAQTTPQNPPATTAPEAPAAAAPVTDAEVDQFVSAAMAAEKVRTDTTIAEADKNAKLNETITGSGLTTQRFNEIAKAMQADPALAKRIQDKAAASQPAAAAEPAPAPAPKKK